MKNIIGLIFCHLVLFISCDLKPLPEVEPKKTFEKEFPQPAGYSSLAMIDGVQLDNGDFVIIGNATKNGKGDLLALLMSEQGEIKEQKFFDGLNDKVASITKDDAGNLYIGGRDEDTKKGIIFKLSTKTGSLAQEWFKTYDVFTENVTIAQVEFLTPNIYAIKGNQSGLGSTSASRTGYFSVKSADGSIASTSNCTDNATSVYVVLDAIIAENKIIFGGHGSNSSQISTLSPSNNCTLISKNYNTTVDAKGGFNVFKGIVFSGGNLIGIADKEIQSPYISKKTVFVKMNVNDLTKIQTDSVSVSYNSLNDYQVRSATASADNVSFVYAASYYFSDEKQTTDLVRVGNVVMQPLWTRKYNIYTFKLINVRDGGYLLIGKLNSTTEKIIRVNPAGEL